jgi:hypothetical protein
VSPKQPAATDLFLNVMQVMDRSVAKPLVVEKIESGETVGVRIADRVVVFNAVKDRGHEPVSFKIPGAGTVRVLVTDLAEGQWKLSRDGQSQQGLTVGEAGTAYFEGPAGSYTLSRGGL